MAQREVSLRDAAAPRAPIRWRSGCVILLASVLFSVGLFLLAQALLAREGAASRSYTGELRPHFATMNITLPAGVTVGEINVAEGQMVRRGDLLISFDQALLRHAIEREQGLLAVEVAHRMCLVGQGFAFPELPHPPSAAVQGAHDIARRACRARFDEDARTKLHINAQMTSLKNRVEMFDSGLQLSRAQIETGGASAARAALDFMIAANAVRSRLSELGEIYDRLEYDNLRRRLARAEALNHAIYRRESGVAKLRSMLGQPGLRAPASGRVDRLRSIDVGFSAGEDIAVIDLLPAETQLYDIVVPNAPSRADGALVSMEIAGPFGTAAIEGHLEWQDGSARVIAQDDGMGRIAEAVEHIALAGPSTHLEVDIATPAQSLSERLAYSIRSFREPRAHRKPDTEVREHSARARLRH
ncbi:MAG: hypothetical protein ACU0DW_14520 [Shimia sp.]